MRIPQIRAWYERLAEYGRVIRYDTRGTGLSERRIQDFTLEDAWSDLDAVADALGLEQFAVFSNFTSGPGMIAYAVTHQERVSDLILFCNFPSAAQFTASPLVAGLVGHIEYDWTLFSETAAHAAIGWSEAQDADAFAPIDP